MAEFAQNLAVVVGINQYGDGINSLETAVNDAKAIAYQLQQDHHYQVIQLTDQQATLSSLEHLLNTVLPEQVQPNSRLLFYFAGHGIALNGDSGPEGYLIPQDASAADTRSYLSMVVLQAALSELPCRHFLGILDCCFAGAFRWSSTRDIGYIPKVIHKERYDRFIQDPAWQVITSAAYDQRALDALAINSSRGRTNQRSRQHSPFAAALLEALSGQADIYPPATSGKPAGDGVITATELYLYLRECVEPTTESQSQRQTPEIWPLDKHDKGEYIFLSPTHALNLPPAPKLDASQNPYLGLSAFEFVHSDLFFGRETLTEKLVNTVEQQPLTVVLGPSGSGKSSLVKAGLIPSIKNENDRPDHRPDQWHILPPVRLDNAPMTSLHQAFDLDAAETGKNLPALITHRCEQHASKKCLLVIDQFESLVTLNSDHESAQCLMVLREAIAANPNQLRIVLTLRSDFEPQFQESALQPYWNKARFIVPPMTRLELRKAIVQPASKRVIYFQSEGLQTPLVDQIINEVADMPGALPLLSFTLSELYLKYLKRQEIANARGDLIERTITAADYQALGGVARSLTQRADSEYEALVEHDSRYETTIRNVMLRMVAVGRSQLARRSVLLSELTYPTSEQRRVRTVIQQFSAARLLVEGKTATGEPYVEPAHDALVLGWQRLLDWRQSEEARLILQRRLTPAAEAWQSQKRNKLVEERATSISHTVDRAFYAVERTLGRLGSDVWQRVRQKWKGRTPASENYAQTRQFLWNTSPYLDLFQADLASENNRLNQLEKTFIQESLLLKRRTTSWRWRLAVAIIFSLSGLLMATLIARRADLVSQAQTLRNSAEVNISAGQQLNSLRDVLSAAQLFEHPLLKIFRPNSQVREEIQGTLQKAIYSAKERDRYETDQGTTRSALSPEGQMVASAGEDGSLLLWDWENQKQFRWPTGQETILSVGFSPDGEKIATVDVEGSVRLWNLNGELLADFQGHTGAVRELSFSPDGRLLATASLDRTIRLWDLQKRNQSTEIAIFRGHQAGVWSVAFSPDGQQIASASDDGTFRRWNLKGEELQQVQAQQGELHVVKFSLDGQRLATAGESGLLRLWTVEGNLIADLPGHQGRVWGLSFNQESTSEAKSNEISEAVSLASSSGDGSVRLWSATGEPLEVLQSHEGPVRDVNFTLDGERLVSSGDDGTLRLWNLQRQQTILNEVMSDHNGQSVNQPVSNIRRMSLSEGERTDGKIAVNTGNKQIETWTEEGELISRWEEENLVEAIALSPDGEMVAIAQSDTQSDTTANKVLVRTTQGQLLSEQQLPSESSTSSINHIQTNADGTKVLIIQSNGSIHLWNLETQTLDSWRDVSADITSATLSTDGERVATAGKDGIIHLWNASGEIQGQLEGHLGAVHGIAFDREGQQIASAGEDGTVRIWDKVIFQVYSAEVNAVAFSEDGNFLASADSEGGVQLWNLKTQAQFSSWNAHSGSAIRSVSLTPQALITLSTDGMAYLWPLRDFQALRTQGCALLKDFIAKQAVENKTRSSRQLCADVPERSEEK